MRGLPAALSTALALTLAGAGAAEAATLEANGVLPPGQSGFVSVTGLADGTGSPHLIDQTQRFIDFDYRSFEFNQPGAVETPRAGVTVSRDAFGVPTIDGDTEDDAWFGVGYAVAQDRLFQLELFRRATSGRLAEIVGPGYLDDDLIARRDYYTDAEIDEMIAAMPQDLQDRTQSYADGVNAWIAHVTTSPGDMPGEFVALSALPIAQWTVRDSARVGVFLARTVPSSDGAELENALALAEAGPRSFERLLPVRTKGALSTVPRSEGVFKAQPGRSRADERRGFRRSRRFLARNDLSGLENTAEQIPKTARAAGGDPGAGLRSILPSPGGSFMWAISDPERRRAYLFNGPQLGYSIPELFVEFELHSPEMPRIHGVSAAGVPLIGIGHNGDVAWGFTSGLSDEDDLFVEKLTGPETYRFKGAERQMDCRDETFTWKTPPTDLPGGLRDLISNGGPSGAPPAGATTERICRTVHGPVQHTGDDLALARRYAIWDRELETIVGIDMLNKARSIADVDEAMSEVTWNENVIAADDRGHIGYWHPGLHPLRAKRWDERLPFPGNGRAEWRGLLPRSKTPRVIDPAAGWLANWNNVPSAGWTNGDAEASERSTGPLHRVRLLRKLVGRVARNPSYARSTAIVRTSGTTAQQFPFRDRAKLRAARGLTDAGGRAVLAALSAWNGSYHQTDANGTVDPGVAIWEEFKDRAEAILLRRLGQGSARLAGEPGRSHMFDSSNGEVAALRQLGAREYARAAKRTFAALETRFGTKDVAAFREKRRLYPVGAQGAGAAPKLPFFDRGTWEQSIAMGRP
ncbi:MAG: penicillin acylase family protein [Solirubrobacterales bacterium]